MLTSAEDPIDQLPYQDWDTFSGTGFDLVNIGTQGVAPNGTHVDFDVDNSLHQFEGVFDEKVNLEGMMSSLELLSDLSASGQDSTTFQPVESPSSIYIGASNTKGNLPISEPISLQNYQDILISDTTTSIQGVANWTPVDNIVDQLEGVFQREVSTQQNVALPQATTNLEGISLTRADSPQRTNLERNSCKIFRRFSPTVTSILSKWFAEDPYPGRMEFLRLSGKTHLSYNQVENWFIAERGRELRRQESGLTGVGVTLKKKNKLSNDSVKVLKAWTDNNSANQRPTITEKRFLAKQAKLEVQQVSDWFGGYRKKQVKLQFSLGLENELEKEDHGSLFDTRGGLGMNELEEDHGSILNMRGLNMPDLDVQELGNNAEIHHQNIGFVNQLEDHEGLLEMKEGGLGISDLDAKEPRNNAEIQEQSIGFVYQLEQDLVSGPALDFWDELMKKNFHHRY